LEILEAWTYYVNGSAPGMSATRLNNNENKVAELDTALASHKTRHSTGGADALTAANIGAAAASHTHAPANITPQGTGSTLDADTLDGSHLSAVITAAVAAALPSGLILLWHGSSASIPSGWVLCDGNNGTPNLRDKFIVGAGSTYAVAATGGEATHTLSADEMPAHAHGGTTGNELAHTHSYNFPSSAVQGSAGTDINVYAWPSGSSQTSGTGKAHAHEIMSAGSGTAHNNLPPYYALCYIMKT